MPDLILAFIAFFSTPLSIYLLGVPLVLSLVAWFCVQDMATGICRAFGWRRPGWAVSYVERP